MSLTGWSANALTDDAPANQISLRLYTEEYPPFNFTSAKNITGVNTELIRQTLAELNIEGRFEIVPWGRAQRFTQTHINTCFYSAVRTAAREHQYQWVGPLIKEHVQLFSLDAHHRQFSHMSEAIKYRIGGQASDAYTDFAISLGLKIDLVAEIPVNLERLQLKRIDLWLAGSIGGPFIAAQKGVKIYPVASSEQLFELWLACHPETDADVIQKLNQVLKAKQMDGTLDKLLQF